MRTVTVLKLNVDDVLAPRECSPDNYYGQATYLVAWNGGGGAGR